MLSPGVVRVSPRHSPLAIIGVSQTANSLRQVLFRHNVLQLLHSFPLNATGSDGSPFWSPPKRPPVGLLFTTDDPLHMSFVVTGANLLARAFGIPGLVDHVCVASVVANQPPLAQATGDGDDEACSTLRKSLPLPGSISGRTIRPIAYEKDDDDHVSFVVAAANLRARNYDIAESARLRIKQIAGKILPALATTTAAVSGLASLELLKLLQPDKPLSDFQNGFVNLALPLLAFSAPLAAPRHVFGREGITWTMWDHIMVDEGREITLDELRLLFSQRYGLEVSMVAYGASLFYVGGREVGRHGLTLSQLANARPGWDYMDLKVACRNGTTGDDVDVPDVRYRFRGWAAGGAPYAELLRLAAARLLSCMAGIPLSLFVVAALLVLAPAGVQKWQGGVRRRLVTRSVSGGACRYRPLR